MAVINPLDPANYTPTKNKLKDLSPFRFWCQKVLPLVYDDSLSYYELLCKVVQYLNDTIENMRLSGEDIDNLHYAFVMLQDYTNEYFSRLDVQEEINGKLDEMAEDGTLEDLINPLLPHLVTNWLDENITPTTPPIDSSLTVESAGADAKVTGEYVRDHEERLRDLEYFPIDVEVQIDPTTVEIGTTVPTVALGYQFNKKPISSMITYAGKAVATGQEIEGGHLLGEDFAENTTFTVQGEDDGAPHHPHATVSKSVTLQFWHKVHYGVHADAALSDDLLLTGLQSHVLTDTRRRNITVNAGNGQYIWYAIPDGFGTPKFAVGPLEGGFRLVGKFSHTNEQGHASTYQVWRSDHDTLGNLTISIT